MKRLLPSLILTISLFCFTSMLNAQTTVTGHVFAEVVETVGVRSATNNNLSLRTSNPDNKIDLGSVSVSGGALSVGNFMVSATDLTGENGSKVSFNATVSGNPGSHVMNEDGVDKLNLSASVQDELFSLQDRYYAGNYNVVFAYN